MNWILSLLLGSMLVLSTGCASMFRGTEQEMTFRSEPVGASVYADGLLLGKTPLTFKLLKDEYKSITIKKAGYKDETIKLETRYDALNLLNILNLGMGGIGFTIDASTGAMYQYEPGKFQVNLQTQGKASTAMRDRDAYADLMDFARTYFYRIKSQCSEVCGGEYFATLVYIISETQRSENILPERRIQQIVRDSQSTDDFIAGLESLVKQTG